MNDLVSKSTISRIGYSKPHRFSFFELAYAVWLFISIVFNSTAGETVFGISSDLVYKVTGLFALCVLLVAVATQKYTTKQALIVVVLTAALVLSFLLSGRYFLLLSLAFVIAAQHAEIWKVAKITYYVTLTGVVCVIVLMAIGVFENLVMARGDSLRYGMGFVNQNTFGMYILQLIAARLVCWWDVLSKKDALILVVFLAVGYGLCGTRALLLVGSLMLGFAFSKRFFGYPKSMPLVLSFVPIVCCAGSLFFMTCYSEVPFGFLDDLMSTRLSQMHDFWTYYGVSLFGQNVSYGEGLIVDGMRMNVIDNAYGHVAILFGVIPLLIMVVAYSATIMKAVKESCYPIALVLVSYSLLGLFETGMYRLSFAFILITFSYVLYKKSFYELRGKSVEEDRDSDLVSVENV